MRGVLGAMALVNLVVGQADVAMLGDLLPLLNTGALGVFLFGFYREWWVTGGVYSRMVDTVGELRSQIKTKDDEIARLNAYFQETVIPSIIRFTDREAERFQQRLDRHDEK